MNMITECGEYNSRAPQLTIDLMVELLKRLPIKTLISKLWCSIIRDSLFANVYRRHNRYCVIIRTRHSRPPQLTMDLLIELFTRLPTKALILKCIFVSKFWCSIIRDSLFADVYRRRNPYCVIIHTERKVIDTSTGLEVHQKTLHCYPLGGSPEQSVSMFNIPSQEYHRVTEIVNGLFCYYSKKRLFLANIFTHETMPLPNNEKCIKESYYLGFDPVHKVYKLLCKTVAMEQGKFEILMLSKDSSWRELGSGYNSHIKDYYLCQSILINGVFYWMNKIYYSASRVNVEIYSFNFIEEKFAAVTEFTHLASHKPPICLVQFGGRLSLSMWTDEKMRFFILEEDEDGEHEHWTNFEAAFHYELRFMCCLFLCGHMPNGEVLLIRVNNLIYIYVYKNGVGFVGEVVGKLPMTYGTYGRYAACVEQNITPLDTLF